MEFARSIALEVEFGNARQAEPFHDIPALPLHVRRIGDLKRRGVAISHRISAYLSAGELAGDAAALIHVAMVAFDLRFPASNEFLSQKIDADIEQLRPQHAQRLG